MRNPSRFLHRHSGFTLIEVLAVLIVIGIAASVVTFSVGDGTRPQQIKASARQLYNSMNLAIEEAVFMNRQIGLRFDVGFEDDTEIYRYEWLQYNAAEKTWQPLDAEEFGKQSLPDSITLKLVVEEQEIVIGGEKKMDSPLFEIKKQKDEKTPIFPDLYFLSSGEMQNFSISIADESLPDSEYVVTGNMLGQIDFRRPDEKK